MKLNDLQPNEGSIKTKVRVGRGIASGKGKTCGRGQKGQKSRSGVAINGFEGGQMPLYKRMPKRGFNNIFAPKYVSLTLAQLQHAFDSKKLDPKKAVTEDSLVAAKVIRRKCDGVKILATGTLKEKTSIEITAASKGAIQAIEKAGGTFKATPQTGKRKAANEKRKARRDVSESQAKVKSKTK